MTPTKQSLSEINRLQSENTQLRKFATGILDDYPNSFPDGFDIHDLALETGLLENHRVFAPCDSDYCMCADIYPTVEMADGVNCYRFSSLLTGE